MIILFRMSTNVVQNAENGSLFLNARNGIRVLVPEGVVDHCANSILHIDESFLKLIDQPFNQN